MEDSQRLVNELLPMAKMLLERYGELFPMGAAIGADGFVQQAAAAGVVDQANPILLAEVLRQFFADRAEQGELRASALIQDHGDAPAGDAARNGALSIEIEHFTGYNVTMMVPYRRLDGRVTFTAPIVREGTYRIFPRRQE